MADETTDLGRNGRIMLGRAIMDDDMTDIDSIIERRRAGGHLMAFDYNTHNVGEFNATAEASKDMRFANSEVLDALNKLHASVAAESDGSGESSTTREVDSRAETDPMKQIGFKNVDELRDIVRKLMSGFRTEEMQASTFGILTYVDPIALVEIDNIARLSSIPAVYTVDGELLTEEELDRKYDCHALGFDIKDVFVAIEIVQYDTLYYGPRASRRIKGSTDELDLPTKRAGIKPGSLRVTETNFYAPLPGWKKFKEMYNFFSNFRLLPGLKNMSLGDIATGVQNAVLMGPKLATLMNAPASSPLTVTSIVASAATIVPRTITSATTAEIEATYATSAAATSASTTAPSDNDGDGGITVKPVKE